MVEVTRNLFVCKRGIAGYYFCKKVHFFSNRKYIIFTEEKAIIFLNIQNNINQFFG